MQVGREREGREGRDGDRAREREERWQVHGFLVAGPGGSCGRILLPLERGAVAGEVRGRKKARRRQLSDNCVSSDV